MGKITAVDSRHAGYTGEFRSVTNLRTFYNML